MQWNDLIHIRRLELGLSRPQLARLTGVRREQVWRWEQGFSSPYPNTAVRLGQVLGVEPKDIRRPKEVEGTYDRRTSKWIPADTDPDAGYAAQIAHERRSLAS